METQRRYRMYGLTPYNLSPIQQGIQFGHAVVEYGLLYFNNPDYQSWAKNDKTFIILNGGTTNIEKPGSLNVHEYQIEAQGIRHANFFEEDLGDQLTAVVFLVDDRVWDKETWPDYEGDVIEEKLGGRSLDIQYYEWEMNFAETEEEVDQIIFLRDFLKQFRFA
jgi:hypothetical protein